MSQIISISLKKAELEKLPVFTGDYGTEYYNLTLFVDESKKDRFGNTVAVTESQTKEQREAKVPKNYVGNGKVMWTGESRK